MIDMLNNICAVLMGIGLMVLQLFALKAILAPRAEYCDSDEIFDATQDISQLFEAACTHNQRVHEELNDIVDWIENGDPEYRDDDGDE